MTQAPSDPSETIATAPKLPPWPPGLSSLREDVGETCVGEDRIKAINARLRACGELTTKCQKRLDTLWGGCRALVDGAVEVGRADALGAKVEAAAGGGVETWQALVGGAVLVVLAGGVGYLAGRIQ